MKLKFQILKIEKTREIEIPHFEKFPSNLKFFFLNFRNSPKIEMNTRAFCTRPLKIFDENELIKENKRHQIKLEKIGKMKHVIPAGADDDESTNEVLDRSEMDFEEQNEKEFQESMEDSSKTISTPSFETVENTTTAQLYKRLWEKNGKKKFPGEHKKN